MTSTTPAGSRVVDRGLSMARTLVVGSAIDDSDLDVYEFRVYAHLKRRAADGEVWEKQERMAAICKMSRKKVNEVLASLEAKGWIEQENRKHKGQQVSNMIYLLEPPCHPQLHGQVTDSYTAVSPTVTAKGIPHQGTPQEGKKRVAPAAPALSAPQEGQQQQDPTQTPAADAEAPHGASEATAGPAQVPAQPTANAEPSNTANTEKVPGGGAAAGGRGETERWLRRKLSNRFVDQVLEEIQPLGVNRRVDWFALPLARVEELLVEAQQEHQRKKTGSVVTHMRSLLDEECRRLSVPMRTPDAPASPSAPIDMDDLMASAPLNGTARRNR